MATLLRTIGWFLTGAATIGMAVCVVQFAWALRTSVCWDIRRLAWRLVVLTVVSTAGAGIYALA